MNRLRVTPDPKHFAVIALCLAPWSLASLAQTAPPVVLEVELENYAIYWYDLADPVKLASVPNQTTAANRVFMQNIHVADIVAVNGKAARGTYLNRIQNSVYRPSATAGQTIADITRNGGPSTEAFEFMQPDGTPIGTVMGIGLTAGTAPPGSPTAMTSWNVAIVGGTGAFLGARGQSGAAGSIAIRQASQTEDPSLRRLYGGNRSRMVIHLIPMSRPEITLTSNGPAVFHSEDFTLVTSTKPARVGELLVISATGLGPVRPGIELGKPFPPFEEGKLHEVNSPVEVTVNGKAAAVLNKIGWPTLTGVYRVDFMVPEGTAPGPATVVLSAAWIASPEVKIEIH
jgi:uncharacterized protein (TIGR03437 family)